MLALIRSTTDNIIARYVMSYTYSDRFEKELARVKKMAEILPDKGEKYLREMNNKKHIPPGAPLPETILENVRGEKCQLSDLKGNWQILTRNTGESEIVQAINNSITGTKMAVIMPITPMANPLIAPSTAPSSMALAVPRPWAAEPKAYPRAIRLLIPKRSRIKVPTKPPKIPTTITTTAAMAGIPPDRSAILIAIGVVTDFGSNEAIKA